jgi:hypothetical protein
MLRFFPGLLALPCCRADGPKIPIVTDLEGVDNAEKQLLPGQRRFESRGVGSPGEVNAAVEGTLAGRARAKW